MVLEGKSHLLGFFLDPMARAFRNVDPNLITWMSLPVATLAGAFLYTSSPDDALATGALFWAALAISVMGVMDLLDGRIARMSNRATAAGDFLDHVMDRFIDIILLVAISFSAWGDVGVGFFALAGTLLTSYMGTQAQAVGARRMYGGFLTRADRIVLLIAAPLADHLLLFYSIDLGLGHGADHALGIVLYYIGIAGFLTSIQRFVLILRALNRPGGGSGGDRPLSAQNQSNK